MLLMIATIVLLIYEKTTAECDIHENKELELTPDQNNFFIFDYQNREPKENVLDSSAKCSNVTLASSIDLFPYKTPYNLQYIVFENSNLSLISNGIFDNFVNLTILYMNNTSVKIIHPGAFNRLTLLKELHLQENGIEKVYNGILNSLASLQKLYLQNNKITEIGEFAFTGLNLLEYLFINNNDLEFIPPSTFDTLTKLKQVDFSYNFFRKFEVNSMISLTYCDLSFNLLHNISTLPFSRKLEDLRLNSNQIGSVLWKNSYAIKHIDLSSNNLTEIFEVGSTLITLDISMNKITSLNGSRFQNASLLESLHLNENSINSLTVEFSKALVELKYLYLHHNFISIIPVGYFRNLKKIVTLDLSYNMLTTLEYGTFIGIQTLQRLDISNNQLNHLYESSFYRMSDLTDLFLQNNRLTSLDAHHLKLNVKSLTNVQLDQNNWTCKYLSKLLTDFYHEGVTVALGFTETTSNVHGISCRSENAKINSTEPLDEFLKITNSANIFHYPFNSKATKFSECSLSDRHAEEIQVHEVTDSIDTTILLVIIIFILTAILILLSLNYFKVKSKKTLSDRKDNNCLIVSSDEARMELMQQQL